MSSPTPETVSLEAPNRGSEWEILCVTQDAKEPASSAFREVCTRIGTEIADSIHCVGTGCGGHPICRPCLDLAIATGLVVNR